MAMTEDDARDGREGHDREHHADDEEIALFAFHE
jgi:hypothetical protein